MPTVIRGTDNSASAPALTGSDSDTGIFFPAADTIAFAEGGTEVMRIDSSGNVGIGTSSPASILELKAATPVQTFNQTTANSNQGVEYRVNGTAYGRILNNATTGILDIRNGLTGGAGYVITLSTDGSERARIDSSGNLLVGTTSVPSGGQKMNIAGGITPTTDNSFIFGNSGLRWQALYAANGTIQTSDERQKTDIVESPLGLNFVMTLRPVAYKFKVGKNVVEKDADGNNVVTPVPGKRQHFGLLSQQVKQAVGDVDFGGWIHTDLSDPESDQGLRYDEFVAPLIKAIQEQQAIITALTARVAALEAANAQPE